MPNSKKPAHRTYHMIHELYVLYDACDDLVLNQYGLNTSQYRLLNSLELDHGQRMTTLSERLILSKSSITRIVDQLEHLGWVQRIPDPKDRRAQSIVLTPEGAQQRAVIAAAHQQSLQERMQFLDDGEHSQLNFLMDKLCDGLRSRLEADRAA